MNVYLDPDGFEYGDFEPVRVEMRRPISFDGWLQKNGYKVIGATGAVIAQLHLITLHTLGRGTRASVGKAKGDIKRAQERAELYEKYESEVQPVPRLITYSPDKIGYEATKRLAIKRNKRFNEMIGDKS